MGSGLEGYRVRLRVTFRKFGQKFLRLHHTKFPTINTNTSCNEHSCNLTCMWCGSFDIASICFYDTVYQVCSMHRSFLRCQLSEVGGSLLLLRS